MTSQMIQPHNVKAAATWDSGGLNYNRISQTIADAIEHCVTGLMPQPGERILDVVTVTGWALRPTAARGANVIGVDLGADLIKTAEAYATEVQLIIGFQVRDAEALPFEDTSFDVVVSTIGVILVNKPEAAAELPRLCTKGSRIGLISWSADGGIASLS
jgi:2-polyprenyl-3-methyl-5-hydroxy-6-metoxy-1,4-benzoquinol methylase